MDIQHLLGRLEAVLLEARRVPGTKLKLVDVERCFQLIDQMVLAIPEEIKKAQRIQQEYDRIIAQAKEEAERIKELAREEASRLADDEAIIAIAQNRAQVIEERARREADRMRAEADAYALETLIRLRDELSHTLAVVSNGITKLERDRAERLQAEQGLAEAASANSQSAPT
jgi:cell division septum initiation protein DivIVA